LHQHKLERLLLLLLLLLMLMLMLMKTLKMIAILETTKPMMTVRMMATMVEAQCSLHMQLPLHLKAEQVLLSRESHISLKFFKLSHQLCDVIRSVHFLQLRFFVCWRREKLPLLPLLMERKSCCLLIKSSTLPLVSLGYCCCCCIACMSS
jgi:hypothetical protein